MSIPENRTLFLFGSSVLALGKSSLGLPLFLLAYLLAFPQSLSPAYSLRAVFLLDGRLELLSLFASSSSLPGFRRRTTRIQS